MLKDLLLRNRSYRRFEQEVRISEEELTELVGLTCLCASARNAQALKYVIVHEEEKCAEVFPQLAWAGYLKDWDGPEEGERPAAYLIQLLDTRIVENCLCDDGIQAQTILLGAVEKGFIRITCPSWTAILKRCWFGWMKGRWVSTNHSSSNRPTI